MAIRWTLAYSLSDRHIEELMAERGVNGDHSAGEPDKVTIDKMGQTTRHYHQSN